MFIKQVADIDIVIHVAAILVLCPFFTTFDVTSHMQLSFLPVFKLDILGQRLFLSIPHNISTEKLCLPFSTSPAILPPTPPPHPPPEKKASE